jgi:predicted HicB family RNase H-like nuclease
MSKTVSYRGFDGSIIHDAADDLFHGQILGVPGLSIYHGHDEDEAEQIFREAVDDYIQHFLDAGMEVPAPFATFPINLPHELRVKAALYAQEHEISVEDVLASALHRFLESAPLEQAA